MDTAVDCEEMQSIATFLPLRVLLFSFLTISVIAIPLIMSVILRIIRNPLYHLNTKVVLVAHAFSLICHQSNRLLYHGLDLYRFIVILPNAQSPCDILSSSERCFGLRIAFNCTMWFCICTTPSLTLERYLATRRAESYQSDRHSWFPVLVFQCLLSAVFLAFVYVNQVFGGKSPYCLAVSASLPFNVLAALAITLFVQTISILVYRYLLNKNERLRQHLQRSGGALIKKYQVEETLRAFRILYYPVHVMFFTQFIYAFVSFFVLKFNFYFSRPLYYFLIEANIYLPEYSVAFAVIFIRMESRVSDSSSKTLKENIEVDPSAYFENYKKDWS